MRTIQEIVLELPGTPEFREHITHVHDVEKEVDNFLHRLDAELGSVAGITEVSPAPCCTRSSRQPKPNRHINAVLTLQD